MGGSLSKVVIEPLRPSNDLHNRGLANFLADYLNCNQIIFHGFASTFISTIIPRDGHIYTQILGC